MLNLVAPNLSSLAERINAAHVAFESRSLLGHAIEAGKLLLQVKEQLEHGVWLPWLKENFSGSQPTASRYMTIAERAAELVPNYSRVNSLSLRAALKLLNKNANANGDVDETPADLSQEDNEIGDAPASTESLESLIEAGHVFGTIYADPPWKYGNQATRASTDNHYPTMTVEEIALLPVKELAAEKCHLWLWTTNGFIFECPKLFEAWGFEFKSSYVWCKTQMGIGNYLRNAHEFLLLATKGGLVGAARDVRSWGEFPRGKHSSKPEKIREDVIERVSPGPRLELFGRATVPGWTVWGNQVRKDLFDDARV